VLTALARDGTQIRADDAGAGRCVLIVHPGLDDGRSWRRVATALEQRYRVVRVQRRRYRPDLAADCSMAEEADDVVALAEAVGEPVLLVGHSSGGVVALEALLRAPAAFAGALVYEAPVELSAGEFRPAVRRAQEALRAGRVGRALTIFFGDVVGVPRTEARVAGAVMGLLPRWRTLAGRQIADLAAIDDLGVRLDDYAGIRVPLVLLGGARSPAHLQARARALAAAVPGTRIVVLPDQGHDANRRAPAQVVAEIEGLAGAVLP
jgi:pimeloyl-ACP methyl ester carboxylesterase